jgi:ribonuclease-3
MSKGSPDIGAPSLVSISQMKIRQITALQETLGHRFADSALLQQALTHSSRARELETQELDESEINDNEQLEFLGDAVLSLVTSEELFRRFPQFQEGELSKLRAHLVSEKHLVCVAQKLEIGNYLHLGRGEEKSGGRQKTTLLVDALEALLGAVYLDAGLHPVRSIILQHIVGPELEMLGRNGKGMPLTDYKSALQEKLQAAGRPQLSYTLVEERGPEHRKTFTVEARLRFEDGGEIEFAGRSQGSTKKSAEQEAARQVLEYLASHPEVAAGKNRKVHAQSP